MERRHAVAVLSLGMCSFAAISCGGGGAAPALPPSGGASLPPVDAKALLPFDPLDDAAAFTATLQIDDRAGNHPKTTLTYQGTTYTSDESGKLVIPNAKVSDHSGLVLQADGYLSRSVVLDYQRAGSPDGMRVVLESPGVTRQFSAMNPGYIAHGPIQISFTAGSFAKPDGTPYTGTVHAALLGIDPVASVVSMSDGGFGLRPDFDIDRVPQGYGLATSQNGSAHFFLPESIMQLQLSDDDGSPLQLANGDHAAYTFKLSGITVHKAGDVLPTYSFDESAQHWVEAGSCTVQTAADGSLECQGSAPHFSTWSIASGMNTANPSCGNFQFRIKADATYEAKPVALQIDKVYGRSSVDDTFQGDLGARPDLQSTSGMCFYQAYPFAYMRVLVTLRRVERLNGQAVDDRFAYVLGKGASSASEYDHNLTLVRAVEVTASDLNVAALDRDCLGCPPAIVDLDLRGKTAQSSAMDDPSMPMMPVSSMATCSDQTCGPGATCLPSGACSCPDGQSYQDKSTGCVTPSCMAGSSWDAQSLACETIDACMTDNGGCDAHATCAHDDAGAVTCSCNAGYLGDGKSCTAMTRCSDNPCRNGGTCKDGASGYSCSCPSGWSGANCEVDINECAGATAVCDANADCTNTDGSYSCACKPGYSGSGAPKGCTNIDACIHNPCSDGSTCVDMAPPALDTPDGRSCVAGDPCATNNGGCDAHATCENNQGTASCICNPGYVTGTSPNTCVDLDACVDNPCDPGSLCTDLPAPAPDDGSGRTCTQITDCNTNNGGCDQHATCSAGQGSVTCTCDTGYVAGNTQYECVDVDACTNNPCASGYTCSDLPAPAPDTTDGRTCTDIDECQQQPYPCDLNATCQNTDGSFTCTCNADYVGDGFSCQLSTQINADLMGTTSGTELPGQNVAGMSSGIDVTYNGSDTPTLTGITVTGLGSQTEAYARIYDSSQTLVASGMNTSVSGGTAQISFLQGYTTHPADELRVVVMLVDGTATFFQPAQFGYTDQTGTFTINGAYQDTNDVDPTTSVTAIPEITLWVEPLGAGGGGPLPPPGGGGP